MQVAISGGGISGLALAYRLLKESKTLRVSLIEKAPRIGGWLQTYRKREYLFEKGPRSLRVTNGSHTLELLKDLDLTPMPTSPSANSRYIFCSTNSEPSQIHELPNSFGSIFKSSLMKSMLPNMLTMQLRQALKFGKSDQSDQTIHEYFSSQFGEEFSRKFMGALCSGIFAGDPEKLSLKECFPSIESWHQNSGRTSIIAAMLLARMKVILAGSQSGKKPNVPYSSYSFQNGIEELPMKLEQEMLHRFPNRVEILKNSSILNLSEKGKADRTVLELSLNDRVLEVDHLFCSTPAYETAKLFKQTKENKYLALARLLDEIHYTDVAVINLGWLTPLDLAYQGFGYLVSPTELDENILGVSFDR
jgi:oxygen-dependent protoporphyrinogen oxidase